MIFLSFYDCGMSLEVFVEIKNESEKIEEGGRWGGQDAETDPIPP